MELRGESIFVTDKEVYQAQLGFESIGAADLSADLGVLEYGFVESVTEVDHDVARKVLAGNMALYRVCREIFANTMGSEANNRRDLSNGAYRAVTSGVDVISQLQRTSLDGAQ